MTEGHYPLRTNITDWQAKDLWEAYIHLTDAEEAFRIHKSDLNLRPLWHQKDDRIQAHIFVCFLSFVLWKTFGLMCNNAGRTGKTKELLELRVKPAITSFLIERGLTLSSEKTRIIRIDEGFDFLGQHLRKYKKRHVDYHSVAEIRSRIDGIAALCTQRSSRGGCMVNDSSNQSDGSGMV
jgi:hypothetical protein